MSVGGGVLAPTSPSMGMAVGAGSSAGRGSKHPKKDLLVCTLCGARSRSTARVPPSPLLSPPSPPLSPPSPPLSVSPPPPLCPNSGDASVGSAGKGMGPGTDKPPSQKGAAPNSALQSSRLDRVRPGRGSPRQDTEGL